MKKIRIFPLFLILYFVGIIFSASTLAEDEKEKDKELLVALGDSITAGYNLEDPSSHAFPYLIGDGQYDVSNLAVPGWTSSNLLYALRNEEEFLNHLENADVITINIGSNDLIQALNFYNMLQNPYEFDLEQIEKDILDAKFLLSENITEIIDIVQNQSTADIILYTIYNPVVSDGSIVWELLYLIAADVIDDVNSNSIVNYQSTHDQIDVVNAFESFAGNQENYLVLHDIHPNKEGQVELANLATDALEGKNEGEIRAGILSPTEKPKEEEEKIRVNESRSEDDKEQKEEEKEKEKEEENVKVEEEIEEESMMIDINNNQSLSGILTVWMYILIGFIFVVAIYFRITVKRR